MFGIKSRWMVGSAGALMACVGIGMEANAETAENYDYFGGATAAGDFNGDGVEDLAVSAYREDIGSARDTGILHVMEGKRGSVLTNREPPPISQDTWGFKERPGDSITDLGRSMAAGDFNCDRIDDLAVSATVTQAGASQGLDRVAIIYGSRRGLDVGTTEWIGAYAAKSFGFALAVGEMYANPGGVVCEDLAVGAPFAYAFPAAEAGRVWVFKGDEEGLEPTASMQVYGGNITSNPSVPIERTRMRDRRAWYQSGLDGLSAATQFRGRHLGYSLAFGDFMGTGLDSLAVGMPGENWSRCVSLRKVECTSFVERAGRVLIFRPSSSVYRSDPDRSLAQGRSPGYYYTSSSVIESGDEFGYSLVSGDFNNDGIDDLVVGAPFEDIEVSVYRPCGGNMPSGCSGTLVGTHANAGVTHTFFGHPIYGIWNAPKTIHAGHLSGAEFPSVRAGAEFGKVLGAGNFKTSSSVASDLLISSSPSGRARLAAIPGARSGLKTSAAVWLAQGSTLPGSSTTSGDRLGASISMGDFDDDGKDDIAIGAPYDSLVRTSGRWPYIGRTTVKGGSLFVVPGGRYAPDVDDTEIWFQDDLR